MALSPASTSLFGPAIETMAYAYGFRSFDQRQTRGCASSALRASLPVAGRYQFQDRPGLTHRAGFTVSIINLPGASVPGLSRNSYRPDSSPGRRRVSRRDLLPAVCGIRHLIRATRLQSGYAQSIPDQHVSQSLTGRYFHNRDRLSYASSDCAVSSERKGLGNARKAFGELRNV